MQILCKGLWVEPSDWCVIFKKASNMIGPRAKTQSEPECQCGCDGDACEEVDGEFVVAGGGTAEVLKAAEDVLDNVPATVSV